MVFYNLKFLNFLKQFLDYFLRYPDIKRKCINVKKKYALKKKYRCGTFTTYSRWAAYLLSYIDYEFSCESYTEKRD